MKKITPYLALTALVSLVYGNTLFNSFHFDDFPSILEKPWIRGLDKIPVFIFSLTSRPLVILTFNLNYAISGFQVWSYHVFNILMHLGVVFMVYRLGLLIVETQSQFGEKGNRPDRRAPFVAALVFAAHPLNAQSVTYISSRSAIMAAFFYVAAAALFFAGFLRYAQLPGKSAEPVKAKTPPPPEKPVWLLFAASGLAFFLGVFTKETVLTLPGMLFFYHYYFVSGTSFREWLKNSMKNILIAGGVVVAALLFKLIVVGGGLGGAVKPHPPAAYFLTETFVVPFQYFRKMLFPFNLSIEIDFPHVSDWANPANYVGVAILTFYTVLFLSVRNRWAGFGMAWALVTLIPTSSFVPITDVAVEHHTYLPLIGFSLAFAGCICRLESGLRSVSLPLGFSRRLLHRSVCAGIFLTVIFYSIGLATRNRVWKNEVTLWSDAEKKAPKIVRPYNNVGEAYDKLREYDKAIQEFQKALSLNPNYVYALNNLGNIYGKMENYEKSAEYFRKALALKADYAPANYNLARALYSMGKKEEALKYYREAVRINPYFEEAIFNLAHIESGLGLFEDSIKSYTQFIEMQPANMKAYFGMGDAYAMMREFDQAIAAYKKAIALNPDYLFPQINLAAVYVQTERFDEAVAQYEKILARSPYIAGIHKNLGLLYSQQKNRSDKALEHFKQSLKLDEKQSEAQVLRGIIARLEGEMQGSGAL